MTRHFFSLFFILIFPISPLISQDIKSRELSIFQNNIQLYLDRNYQQAEQNFALVINKLPNSPLLTSNYLMLVKSQYKLGDYASSLEHAKKFLQLFPESSYRDDIYFVMASSYFQLRRYLTAAKNWLNAILVSDDPRLENKSETKFIKIISHKLNDTDLEELLETMPNSEDAFMLTHIAWATKEYKEGHSIPARNRLNEAINQYPTNRYANKARNLLLSDGHQFSIDEKFALMLPLTGYNREIGLSIQEGVQLALDEFNEQHKLKIKLAINDYGEEISEALSVFKMIAANSNILAIMGPIENDITAACAALSNYEQIPLISPTASDNGLTNFSNYFFQLNTRIDITAKTIARYALDSLNLNRFATFAPIDNHFIKMVDTFSETIEREGGEVVSKEWYYPGDQDVYKQFMKIKRVGLKLAFNDSLLQVDSLLSPTLLDSLYSDYVKLEEERIEEEKIKVDSADIPVSSIQGVFVPIFTEDLQFIAPQIAYSNIQAQYLGNNDWYDIEQLKKNKNYINGIIFGSDGYLNEESWDYRRFRNAFREKFKKSPDLYAVIGYDSFRYILQAFDPQLQNMSRNQFFRNLAKLNTYNGIYRTIDLNKGYYNKSLRLLKYNYGQIIPLN